MYILEKEVRHTLAQLHVETQPTIVESRNNMYG